MLTELLTRGLPGRHTRYKLTDIGEVPEEWDVVPLDSLVAQDTTITYGIVQAGPHVPGGIPYIRTGDVKPSGIDLLALGRTAPEIAAHFKRSEVRQGDLVFCIRASVGAVALVSPELDGANLTQGTARIAPGPRLSSHFLLWALRSVAVQKWIALQCKGSTFREITLAKLRQTPIPLPSREEQGAITRALQAVDSRESGETIFRSQLMAVKAALAQNLLSGELRVTNAEGTPA
jgi:type I restriction enzyme S subunit